MLASVSAAGAAGGAAIPVSVAAGAVVSLAIPVSVAPLSFFLQAATATAAPSASASPARLEPILNIGTPRNVWYSGFTRCRRPITARFGLRGPPHPVHILTVRSLGRPTGTGRNPAHAHIVITAKNWLFTLLEARCAGSRSFPSWPQVSSVVRAIPPHRRSVPINS